MRLAHPTCLILAAAVVLPAQATPTPLPNRVTILYDAFGGRAGLTRDWGFAALVEYNGKRILFDTGNNAGVRQECPRLRGRSANRRFCGDLSPSRRPHGGLELPPDGKPRGHDLCAQGGLWGFWGRTPWDVLSLRFHAAGPHAVLRRPSAS